MGRIANYRMMALIDNDVQEIHRLMRLIDRNSLFDRLLLLNDDFMIPFVHL